MIEPERTQCLEQVARAARRVVASRDYGPTGGVDIVSWHAMEDLEYWLAMLSLVPKPSPQLELAITGGYTAPAPAPDTPPPSMTANGTNAATQSLENG